MAWQLIYTSAPRLLEAGRSGFGTVARHRQISPLLVSAIERASQFARGPGLDAARVIFCHRIVAVAGGRFHVLSCIRDAGADYTGRTNHIAHHLIAEQREVALLGASGASPADVLLAMRWISSWEEAPRFLEASDEVSLATFAAQPSDQWLRATGDARNAWLLAKGEASRGAYIFHPAGIDARGLFAESLRLAPDRLWQIPFTTALQPSDESSDFRWIAVEADSALRAQAESSNRPVLDLSRPDALPEPEVPANAAIASIPRPTALAAPTREPSPARAKTPARQPAPTRTAPSPTKGGSRKWMIAGGAVALLAAIGFAIIRPQMIAQQDIRNRRQDLKNRVTAARIFSPQAAESFAQVRAEKLSSADQIVGEVEKALGALKTMHFEKMRDSKTGDELRLMGASLGVEVPAEMQTFADRVHRLESLNAAITRQGLNERATHESLLQQRDAIEAFAKETQGSGVFSAPVNELRAAAERATAASLLALLHPKDSKNQNLPPTETALIKEQFARAKPADAKAAKIHGDAEKLMHAWESVQSNRQPRKLANALRDSRGEWPEWLIKQAEAALTKLRGAGDNASEPSTKVEAAAFSSVPLYFFNGPGAVKDARFQELEKGQTFHLQSAPGVPPIPLIDPTKQGTLRTKISEPGILTINETSKQLVTERAIESLPRPFAVIAKNSMGQDALQIWIVSESDKPLFPKKSGGLSRSNDSLTLDPAALGLPGAPKSRMTLRLPAALLPTGAKPESLPVKDWAVDLTAPREKMMRAKADIERQAKALDGAGAVPNAANISAKFRELKQSIVNGVAKETDAWASVERARVERKENDEAKRKPGFKLIDEKRAQRVEQAKMDFGDDAAPLFKQAGGCIKAFSQDATFQGRDTLFAAGGNLAFLNSGADPKALAKSFAAARQEVKSAMSNLMSSEQKARYLAGLQTLDAMIVLLSPETPELKTERSKSAAHLAALKEELRRIETHPIFSNTIPPGVYRVSVFADGAEIPLVDIEIAR